MPQLDASLYIPQLFWLGVAFCLLYVGMRFFIGPRMGRIFKKRHRKLQEKLKEIEQFKTETEQLRLQTALFVEKKQKEMEETLSETSHKSEQLFKKFEESFHQESLKKMASFEEILAEDRKKLMAELKKEEPALAKIVIEKLTNMTVSDTELKKLSSKSKVD